MQRGERVSISVVNGYLCMNSCDAAKARTGQDPHAGNATNQAPNTKPASTQTPAVTFGGALAARSALTPVGAAAQPAAANGSSSQTTIDIQV